jgi:RNase P subunit RPR2
MPQPKKQARLRMACKNCGSLLVTRDAWAEWSEGDQEWVLGAIYDYSFCHDCEDETRIEEHPLKK